MVARGAKSSAVRACERVRVGLLIVRQYVIWLMRVSLPMDIERPPTKAKSMELAPGKVLELR